MASLLASLAVLILAQRLVGRAFESAVVQSMLRHFPYEVLPTDDGLCAVRLGPLTLSMEQVQALVLREVKGVAGAQSARGIEH